MTANTLSRRRLLATAAWSALALAGCGRKPKARRVPPGAIVLALGDSITYGSGAAPETSYPTVLARLTGWNVINAGAQVMLIAVPQPSLAAAVVRSLSDHALYAELADELKLPLHAGGWSGVLSEPALRSDAIHANAQGYEQFARSLAAAAKGAGLLGKP